MLRTFYLLPVTYNKIMSNLKDFLMGTQILKEIESPINGKIQVVRSLGLGTYIQVGGLTQSGGILEGVWRKPLKKVYQSLITNHQSLILGWGGGTAVKLVRKYWPEAEITGVDIDPVMVELGKKYLKFDDKKTKVIIGDARDFLSTSYHLPATKYDLILVDLYVGDEFPEKFENEEFLKLVLKLKTDSGVVIFNRLYWDEKRPLAMKFLKRLEKVFSKVEVVYPEANIMFICK